MKKALHALVIKGSMGEGGINRGISHIQILDQSENITEITLHNINLKNINSSNVVLNQEILDVFQ